MFLAYVLFGLGLRSIRSTAATSITLVEPVVATALAVIVVGERLSGLGWVGVGLILAGVTVIATARHRGQRAPSP
jgi:DME family drug/metabolite transporter